MPRTTFPLPVGSALRWAAKQAMYLRDEGYGDAVLDAVQPLFARYAHTGDASHLQLAHRLLEGER
jgi:hypothetical protein